ncbi:hypothetical protein KC953_00875, partial [Candidatus Saccharibacteria bacterium]|nr:hypothetical protein [Candidatus Saccharibacteria bacterium]
MKNWSARSAIKYAAITIAVVAFAQIPGIASADLLSWTGRMPVVEYDYDVEMASDWNDICVAKFQSTKEVIPINGLLPPYDTTDCLVSATENYSILYGVHTGFSIKFSGDVKAYLIRGVDCEHQRCLYLPSRDSLVVIESNNHVVTGRVAIYKDFVKKLAIDRNSIVDQRFF